MQARCFEAIDDAMRPCGIALLLFSFAIAHVASAMPPPADPKSAACGVGRRATLPDGRLGRVVAAQADGRCELALFDGGRAEARPDELRFEQAPTFDLDAPPPLGVYACQPHGMGLDPATSFGLVDASNYRNAAGERGTWHYDADRRVLELVSGPWAGRRFGRNAGTVFHALDADGRPTSNACLLDPDRGIDAKRW